ncbi:hypothetical protein RE9414_35430 [Prescottella equi]|nr:hypothetical protein RE9414_35430 [Prescottella equi]
MIQDLGNGWVAEMEWKDDEYGGGPAGLLIRPVDPESPPTGGISSSVVRGINFRAASAKLHSDLAARPKGIVTDVEERGRADRISRIREASAGGITPTYLALLSSEYVRRADRGQAKLVEQLAEELGKPLQTVRGHLWQARKQGLLLGSAGKKGGTLSAEAMTILRQLPPNNRSLVDLDPPG